MGGEGNNVNPDVRPNGLAVAESLCWVPRQFNSQSNAAPTLSSSFYLFLSLGPKRQKIYTELLSIRSTGSFNFTSLSIINKIINFN